MQRSELVATLACLILAASLSQARAGDASESFSVGAVAFDEGDYQLALAKFESALAEGMEGPAIRYNIGVCHYELGHYAQAAVVFHRIAEEYPAMEDLARYNFGLALLKSGQRSQARRSLERVATAAKDEKLAALADELLRRMAFSQETQRAVPRFVSLIDFAIGYDDNVALVDDASLLGASSSASAFNELTAVISGPSSSLPGFRFDGTLYSVDYSDTSEFDQTVMRMGGAYHWPVGAWRLEVGPHVNYSTLDGGGFERRAGAGVTVRHELGGAATLKIRVLHEQVSGLKPQFEFMDGSREQVSVTLDSRIRRSRLRYGFDWDTYDREDPGVSPTRSRVWLEHRYPVGSRWVTESRFAYRKSSYAEAGELRDEHLIEISVGFWRELPRRWQLSGKYAWFDNDSDTDAFSYARSRTELGVSRAF